MTLSMDAELLADTEFSIGIGRGLTASPLPHHRTYGSRIRRFGRVHWGDRYHPHWSDFSWRASREFLPDAGPTVQHLAGCHSLLHHRARLLSTVRAFPPSGSTMPSADFYGVVREDCSALSPYQDTPQISRSKPSDLLCISARFIKHSQLWMEDFAVPCQLVPTVPHLLSGSCSSPRTFAPRVLQTPPRGDALALHLSFGSTHTWTGDFHPQA